MRATAILRVARMAGSYGLSRRFVHSTASGASLRRV